MIKGSSFHLRTVREADLPEYQAYLEDISNRGDYYPQHISSEHDVRQTYEKDGFWLENSGILLIVNDADTIIGHIGFFKPVVFWNVSEIHYILFDSAQRGKGIMAEATQLLVRYLFETRHINRIQLQIHPDNLASRRVAEKCGFRHEGTIRGVWFHRGQHLDMDVWVIFRDEVIE